MKLVVIILFLVSLSMAFTVKPNFIGVQYTGSESLPQMDVDLTIDCETKDLIVDVSDNQGGISGAGTVMFYTDYGYQPLPNPGTTDSSGEVIMAVPGTLDFLTGLFILRVDKQGYQSTEIEFAYSKCFQEQEELPPVEEPEEEPELIAEPEEEPEPSAGPETEPQDLPEPEEEPEPVDAPMEEGPLPGETVVKERVPAETCPLGIVLLLLLIFKVKK
jgi:hypothetical protein